AALTVRLRLTVKRNAFGNVLKQQAVTRRVVIAVSPIKVISNLRHQELNQEVKSGPARLR
ncbi:MAG: hypothetical protein WCK15_18290, partial [Pirellula sp.]